MLTLPTGSAVFAVAGLVAAAIPIVIHLLNRRSFRVVNWAAMEFLKVSFQQNRRLLHFRDIALMLLRALVLLLFGLALARPYFAGTAAKLKPNQPIHAVLVIDNSLSMSYAKFNQSLLDEVKINAGKFIDELPDGSAISVIPLCGAQEGFSREAYRSKQDARDAVEHIRILDRTADTAIGADLALRACRGVAELPTKRVVFFGDQQAINWPAGSASLIKELPGVQIAAVASDQPDNTWIDQFILQDGLTDSETPAVFKVVVRHKGATARRDLPVTLSIDGAEVESRVIDLDPGQARELTFPYTFTVKSEPGKPTFVTARASIPADRLNEDDARCLAVPVVAQLPVLFVDQFGAAEDPRKNRYGETYSLRRLLAPFHASPGRTAAAIRLIRFDQVDSKSLEGTRLVVIAGVSSPDGPGTVRLLREFVEQGGQLFIAAGGAFDPAAWNAAAWQDGAGILPLPLDAKPIGQLPETATEEIKPFRLSAASMAGEYFDLAETAPEELQALYSLPLFFKAVRANVEEKLVSGPAATNRPRVLASYDNGAPFLVQRSVGSGQILMMTSGTLSSWNTLARTHAVLLLHRVLRSMLMETLPRRNLGAMEPFTVPVTDRSALYTLTRPDGARESLTVEAVTADQYGLIVRNAGSRGIYSVAAARPQRGNEADAFDRLWEVAFAVNGPSRESDPAVMTESSLRERLGPGVSFRWVNRGDSVRVEGDAASGRDLWRWLIAAVMLGLVAECVLLAWPRVVRGVKERPS